MGLDTVELVMALEEEFGVVIDNAAAEKMQTPGDVIDYLMMYLGCKGRRCLRQHRFYRLRSSLQEVLGLPRREVTLDLKFETILPKATRAKHWRTISDKAGFAVCNWPGLERPLWAKAALWMVCGGVFFGELFRNQPMTVPIERLFAGFILAIGAGLLGLWWTRHCCVVIPARIATVGDLIRETTWSLPKTVTFEDGRARQEIAVRVKKIVIEQLGISESQFREDARFIEDLGCG